jgi:hypothetical protein
MGCDHAAAAAIAAPVDSIDFAGGGELSGKTLRVMCPALNGTPSLVLSDAGFCPEPGVSANRFACGSNQNQGNWITDRSSTRLHQAPGGNSSIDLGDGSARPAVKASPSANRFANGSNQNQGNVMTERSTTRLHQAPGGNSSINLGDDSYCPDVGVTLKKHAGQSIKVRHAPGGASSLCLGEAKLSKASMRGVQDENMNLSNIQMDSQSAAKSVDAAVKVCRHAPGGDATVVLG